MAPGVESALYSLLLSLVICVAAVSVFTAHLLLLLPILLSILGKVVSFPWFVCLFIFFSFAVTAWNKNEIQMRQDAVFQNVFKSGS